MSTTVKNFALFVALLILVVLASWIYVRNQGLDRSDVTAGAAPPVAEDSLPADAHPDLLAGAKALDAGDFAEARRLLSGVPDSDPSYTLALHKLGLADWELGDFQAAHDAFKHLSEIQSENANVYVDLAWAQFRLGHLPVAENTVLRAIELDPANLVARYNVALYRVARGDLVRAIPSYSRAIRADTEHVYVARALQDLLDLHHSNPEIAAVHYAIAFFARTLHRRDLEIEELQHFLAASPSGPAADVARERLAEAQGATGESEAPSE